MENDLLFCSKLMFTNGKIVICKYILFDFIQIFTFVKHIFGLVLLFIYILGVTHMENDLLFCSILKLMFTNGKNYSL